MLHFFYFDRHLLGDINWDAYVKLDLTGTVNNLKQILSCSYLCTNIHISSKNRRMHTYIFRTPIY